MKKKESVTADPNRFQINDAPEPDFTASLKTHLFNNIGIIFLKKEIIAELSDVFFSGFVEFVLSRIFS